MTTQLSNHQNILHVLQLSYVAYDNYREKQYQDYCRDLANKTFIPYRQLHQHDYMRNYFSDMWLLHVERRFLSENEQYIALCEPEMMRSLFDAYVRNLIDSGSVQMYPAPLLREIKKSTMKVMSN